MTYFSDVSLVEFEYVLGFLLERILAALGLDQRVLGNLVLVAVERDEHFRISTRTRHGSSLRSHHVLRLYRKMNPSLDVPLLFLTMRLLLFGSFAPSAIQSKAEWLQRTVGSITHLRRPSIQASCWVRVRD